MNKNRVVKNASWIIGIQIVKSLLGLVISMLTARFLGPSNFGLINYAASIVAFVTPIMYLGLNGVLVQEIVNTPEKEGEILGTSVTMTFLSSLLCVIGVISFAAAVNRGERETVIVCALYSTLLIFQSLELLNYWFQAKLLSKYASGVALFAYAVISGYKIYLLAAHKSIYWFALSNALDYMIIVIGLFIVYKRLGGGRLRFNLSTARRLWGKSRYYIVSNMMIAIFAQTDRIMLKLMINDAATGYYSAAVACAGMTGFVFTAIIDSFRPLIFDDKKTDEIRYEKDMCRLYGIIIYLSLLQSLVITLFSGLIIKILYGAAYSASINALKLIVWYTTFSYLGSVRNIWILAENKQKYLWIINLSGALANVALNYILIPITGIMGAALASLVTQIFTNVIIGFIIRPIRYSNTLMLRALNPKEMTKAIKALIKRV
jgi:O-antigen/teichoic acid export membrane protein